MKIVSADICNGVAPKLVSLGHILVYFPIVVTVIIILIGIVNMIDERKNKNKFGTVYNSPLLKAIILSVIFNLVFKLLMVGGKYLIESTNPDSCMRCVFDVNDSGCEVIIEENNIE